MLYCENWDKVQKKYLEFWARENHDRPLMKLQIIKDSHEKEPVSTHGTLRERWMDTEYILKRANWSMQNTRYFAEAFPNLSPNLGPDWFATGYGAQLEYGETTSWSGHFLTDQDVENYNIQQPINTDTVQITIEEAKDIALKNANLTNNQVTFTEVKLDIENGIQKYELEFYNNNKEYSYEIDANTGKILSYEQD